MFVLAVVKEWHYLHVLAEKKNSLNHVCLGRDNFCWRARRNMPAQVLSVRNNRAKWLFPLLFGWITFTKGRNSRCPQSSFVDARRCIKSLILGVNVIECWSFQHRLIVMMRSPGFVFSDEINGTLTDLDDNELCLSALSIILPGLKCPRYLQSALRSFFFFLGGKHSRKILTAG